MINFTVQMKKDMVERMILAGQTAGLSFKSANDLLKTIVERWIDDTLEGVDEIPHYQDPKAEIRRLGLENKRRVEGDFKTFEEWQRAEKELLREQEGEQNEGGD